MNADNNKRHLIPVLFLAACATAYLFDVLFFDRHLSAFDIPLEKPSWQVEFGEMRAHNSILSDSPTAHYPYRKEFWNATRHGYNTQYLPHIFTGKPTAGQGAGLLSTSLFQFFMDIPDALDWSTWFRLLLAAVFMYLFLIQLGVTPAAAILGSIAWTYNMHQVAWLMYPHHLATQLWLPLLLGLNLCLLKDRSNPAAMLGLVLCVLFFFSSGYTQIVLYSFIFIGLFNTLYVLLVQRGAAMQRAQTWFVLHAMYLIAAVALLPDALWQIQEIAEGLRGNQEFRYGAHTLTLSVETVSAFFKDLLPNTIEVSRLFMPNYKSALGQPPAINEFFRANSVEFEIYFGLVCLYFSLYGLIRGIFLKNRLLILFAVLLFLCLGLLNGNHTLISLLNLIPAGGAGTVSRIITLILFFAVIFVAFGAKFFVEDLSKNRFAFASISLLVMLLWLGAAKLLHYDVLSIREFVPWIGYLFGFLVVCALLARTEKTSFIAPIAIGVSFAELVLAGYNFNTRLESKYHFPENTVIRQIRATDGNFRTALLMDNTAYHHNIFTYYDLSTIGGYSTIAPNDYVYFLREAYGKIHVTLNGILFLFDGNLHILRLLNTRFVVSNLNIGNELIKPVYSNKAETLYEFKSPLERAYCASHQIVNEKPETIPEQLAELAVRYDRPVIVSEPLVAQVPLTDDCKVSDLKVFTSKLAFDVNTDRPAVIFIPINYHAYWRARVNGQEAKLHRANYAFMGIAVPSGASKVTLEFINTKLTIGAIVFIALGLIAIAVALIRVRSMWQKVAIVLSASFLIGKSLLSIPGIMNMEIPERDAPEYTQTR